MSENNHAVGLPEAARRLGLSYSWARQLMAEGKFPIPELRRISSRAWHRFAVKDIEAYLASSTADAEKGAA